MITIDINKQIGCKTFVFPDQQPHININHIEEGSLVRVICSITNANNLLLLLECSNALDNMYLKKKELFIPYLMGARFDRVIQSGDSFDLKVIANLINICKFEKVILFDVHSDVSTALIENSVNTSNFDLVRKYSKEDAVLICPDAGAVKKVDKYVDWLSAKDVVYCNKSRNLSNGQISLKVLEPEKCEGENCVIIDDLCDGGGTFLAIASQIKPKHLTLIVTHGIFSKGIDIFEAIFDEIIVSNSYAKYNHKLITQLNF